jgi:PPK2 family polyphosphate:nucleotide phosphotransferase
MRLSEYRVPLNKKIILRDYPTNEIKFVKSKKEGQKILDSNINKMRILQDKLYASDKYAVLIIFQAMDAAGKDGAIKHVMSGLNPQGTQVFSFKQPSSEELDHDYLWRINKCLPERGRIGIFNRSHYEDVLVVRVHNLISARRIPSDLITDKIWKNRFGQIRSFEKYLYENGIVPVKFFLNVSKEEQKKRFLKRIDDESKNWKFSAGDLEERKYWDKYQKYYEEVISTTSTRYAPWYIIPADKKWFARMVISEIIIKTLQKLDLKYPELDKKSRDELKTYKEILLNSE